MLCLTKHQQVNPIDNVKGLETKTNLIYSSPPFVNNIIKLQMKDNVESNA